MDTSRLKKFAQFARRSLIEQIQSKLRLVLAEESLARRESPKAIKELEQKKQGLGEDQLIERVAYTWFNRFCALRFMDVNQYNRIMVISPISGQFQPEILAEAKAGHLDDTVFNDKARETIQGLLSGSTPSRDGQSEAYRMMIVAVCNDYHRLMPYLFERIEDYTELLMPDDLLSDNSILAYTREAMTPENCESVESIGWLYQFYISEKKDQVFEGLKKNKKITPENIPAATQLFTPHWIVKYLVENSLGRLWMLNNPSSKVIEQMDYYIKPVEEEKDFLKISSPEEIKVCDPACGSGHMLTYAYDLLYTIYLDAGYDSTEIPEKILINNLFGIEIDQRAAELAAFALSMKAIKGNPQDDSNNRRRFFRNPIKPNICRLERVIIDDDALEEYVDFVGHDLFTPELRKTLTEFEEADNFGSLIQPTLKNAEEVLAAIEAKDTQVDIFLADTHKSILRVLEQVKYLNPIYHAVIANPPYLGSKGMNLRMSKWAKEHYPNSKSDLFAMFMERNLKFLLRSGFSSMINMQSWMFLSSYEKLRDSILKKVDITSMLHLGSRAFDSIGGEVVSTTAFTLVNNKVDDYKAKYIRLLDGNSEAEKKSELSKAVNGTDSSLVFTRALKDFRKIPGFPIAYWVSENAIRAFSSKMLKSIVEVKGGMSTSNNNRFLRYWHEVDKDNIGLGLTSESANNSCFKWFPYNKGGDFRKWYGNFEYIVNWENDGAEIKHAVVNNPSDPNTTHWSRRIFNTEYFFSSGITWGDINTTTLSARALPQGSISDSVGISAYNIKSDEERKFVLSLLNSKVLKVFTDFLCPTIHFNSGPMGKLPILSEGVFPFDIDKLVDVSKDDWDEHEESWDFKGSILIKNFNYGETLKDTFDKTQRIWNERVEFVQSFEYQINDYLIDIYGLKEQLSPDIEVKQITLLCNSHYLFNNLSDKVERDKALLKNTILEFISYFVGCIFSRYSIDKKGLIMVNKNDLLADYLASVPKPTIEPDEDNVIPIINFDGDWFEDDITERFKSFLKVTFGEEHFAENLVFIEKAIGKDLKKYFVKDFYTDHIKQYKKRPIYWMFSSPKGSFNALIYMHRYHNDTVSVVLNNYLREFRTKLQARKESYEQVEISASASQKDKTQAIKAIAKINKVLDEINDYEHDVLYPLAGEKVEIDLDDGVKHNYPLFGKALKKVPGLS
ncbi:class I SAM-dependent DNA methyltransferase [Photobacterium frigidiphilum]|uniref:site-specific DNA-methyltransferase (adenine-specific) n=1 Tax=Photobacterium frigidiphilum TaxID=264736 RepID=A0A2T3JA46_9GAMM|nr:BREX-1 system adenine-specific DNA-methyltransferase PglX [Photobacterium frigidiphilum]PSU45720.1 class I SAM-dependent DNA methyltransferase [Photobacterium frigidiphilum]